MTTRRSDLLRRRCAALLLVLAVASASSCAEDLGQSCTLIGCVDTLTVTFDRALGAEYDATVVMGTTERTVSCDPASPEPPPFACSGGGFTVELRPNEPVALTLTSGGQTLFDGALEVTTTTSRPNGPDCPPDCLSGTAAITLP